VRVVLRVWWVARLASQPRLCARAGRWVSSLVRSTTVQRTVRCVPKPRRDLTGPPRVVLYTRVSTGEQADSGAGLAAQESQLRAETERRGWLVVGLLSDAGASGSSMRKRPALADALALVDHGQGDVLAVAKLDRLSRSVLDFAQLMVRARDLGWGLVALDLGVDTTTTSGRLVANVMVSVAEWERDIIGQRTREGLAERRAAGVRLGGPQMVPAPIVARIVRGRRAGCTVRGIAAGLTAEGVPPARGGTVWASSSVQAVLRSQAASAWAGLA